MDNFWDSVLSNIVSKFSADIGTLHQLNQKDNHLYLVSHTKGIPPQVLAEIERIQMGKGIAGAAAESRKPVNICNLQTDKGKVARPGAKATNAEGTICVPVFLDDKVVGTLGVASLGGHTFTEQEINELIEIGKGLASRLSTEKRGLDS